MLQANGFSKLESEHNETRIFSSWNSMQSQSSESHPSTASDNSLTQGCSFLKAEVEKGPVENCLRSCDICARAQDLLNLQVV